MNRHTRRAMWKRLVRKTNKPVGERSNFVGNAPFKYVENALELGKKTRRRKHAERANRDAKA